MGQTAIAKIAAIQKATKKGRVPWSLFLRGILRLSNLRSLKTLVLIQRGVVARNLVAKRSIANASRVVCFALINACAMDA